MISPVTSDDKDDLCNLLCSYKNWLRYHVGEIDEVNRVETEIKMLREESVSLSGYQIARAQDGAAIGCVQLMVLDDVASLKRFYVSRPGEGVGRRILEYAIALATEGNASCITLDTSCKMQAARRLYSSMGFKDITHSVTDRESGVRYFKKQLRSLSP